MSTKRDAESEVLENHVEDAIGPDKKFIDKNHESAEHLDKDNGLYDSKLCTVDTDDELLQMVVELNFQTEYFKSHFEDLKSLHADSGGSYQQSKAIEQDGGENKDVKELREKIDALNRELLEERQTRGAAEEALKHLRAEYSEADAKALELSEAQQKMDQQIKERDEKYSELDSKFNRLHKRAKQRIQEVQKEKDDLEAQFRDVNEKAEQASSQLSALQQELDRTRQQANEALKAIDMERQQLRSANNKLRDNIEELRRSLEPKENALEALQQSLLEKEQMLEDMQGQLQASDDKRQAAIAELSSKHQKQIESLEAQLADTLSDRNKATETISTLQRLLAEKESKIAEMDAASSGEAARLRASMEAVKGEMTHLKHEHSNSITTTQADLRDAWGLNWSSLINEEKEKESWEAATQALNRKLEIAESNCIHAEIEAAKMRSQLELDLSVQTQVLNTKDAELLTAKEEINRLESEFASYKVRAHALLQRKDAELAAARDNEQLKAQEEALKEAEKEILLASAERDKALQDLKDALGKHDEELASRDEALSMTRQQIKNMEMKFNSALSGYQSDKEAWERNLQNVEETWRLRCEALKAQNEVSSGENLQKELNDLKLRYKKLKEEHDSFRDLADKMMEEKDKEITRLSVDNKNLHRSLALRQPISDNNTVFQKQDSNLSTSSAEQQILILARQQAQREEELSQSQRHILALQEEIEELERENRLHSQQEAMLKEELRNMERMQKREGVDMTYLKNVILKLLETGEVEALLPVVAMLLQFSPEEMQKCQQAYRASIDVPPTQATDASGSGLSLLSRFSFS